MEIGGEAVHESYRSDDGVGHYFAALGLLFEVLLDIVLASEMRYVCWVRIGLDVSASIYGGVDEDFDVVGESGVDCAFALFFLTLLGGAVLYGLLYAEDAVDGGAVGGFEGGFEDGGRVVEVAFNELHGWGFLGERFGGW